jgi:hypothetical protein
MPPAVVLNTTLVRCEEGSYMALYSWEKLWKFRYTWYDVLCLTCWVYSKPGGRDEAFHLLLPGPQCYIALQDTIRKSAIWTWRSCTSRALVRMHSKTAKKTSLCISDARCMADELWRWVCSAEGWNMWDARKRSARTRRLKRYTVHLGLYILFNAYSRAKKLLLTTGGSCSKHDCSND